MQLPANMPFEVMCHERATKQASTVYQFHSILSHVSDCRALNTNDRLTLILHDPPILIPSILPAIPVEEAIGAIVVPVGITLDISMLAELIAMFEWSIADIGCCVRVTGR